jgi:hypothetical protein
MNTELIVSIISVVTSTVAVILALLKKKGLSLTEVAVRAVAYGEQMGETPEEKLRHAVGAAQRLDAGDNGKRDWTDAQLRIAIEAEIKRSK